MHPSQILYEDNHLLIVNKPADWVVQGATTEQRSLLESARTYVKNKYQKPGNVFLGVVSRLDAPVTGVVPFAKTSKSASRLNDQFRERTTQKFYWAIVERLPNPISGQLAHDLIRPEHANVTRVADSSNPKGAHRAILNYRLLRSHAGHGLLEIELVTGRKHQIRCQLSSIQCPILGDRLYGARETFPQGIALHCRRLVLQHPTTRAMIDISAPPPIYWPSWARSDSSHETDRSVHS